MTHCFYIHTSRVMCVFAMQARKALADRQKDLEVKTQQLEIKLSNKTEEDIKKARRKSTQAGQNKSQSQQPCLDQLILTVPKRTSPNNYRHRHTGQNHSQFTI